MSETETSAVTTSPELCRTIREHLLALKSALLADTALAEMPQVEIPQATTEPNPKAQEHLDSLLAVFMDIMRAADWDELFDATCLEILRTSDAVVRERLNWFLDLFVNSVVKSEGQQSEHTLTFGLGGAAWMAAYPHAGNFLDVHPLADWISTELDVPVESVCVRARPHSPDEYFEAGSFYMSDLITTKLPARTAELNAAQIPVPSEGYELDEEFCWLMIFPVTLHLADEAALRRAYANLLAHRQRVLEGNPTTERLIPLSFEMLDEQNGVVETKFETIFGNTPFSLMLDMLRLTHLTALGDAVNALVAEEYRVCADDNALDSQRQTDYRPDQLGLHLCTVAHLGNDEDSGPYVRFELYDIATKMVLFEGEGPPESGRSVFVEIMVEAATDRQIGEIRVDMQVVYRRDPSASEAPVACRA